MKILALVLLTIGFSCPVFAQSIEAPGKIFYKMPSGEIATRNVTLQVPARGQGEVILRGNQNEIVAERFFSRTQNGRTIFYVIFDEFPGRQESERAVYRGTYSRGTNKALYYGDVFVVTDGSSSDEDLHFSLSEVEEESPDARYVAGFYFKAEIAN